MPPKKTGVNGTKSKKRGKADNGSDEPQQKRAMHGSKKDAEQQEAVETMKKETPHDLENHHDRRPDEAHSDVAVDLAASPKDSRRHAPVHDEESGGWYAHVNHKVEEGKEHKGQGAQGSASMFQNFDPAHPPEWALQPPYSNKWHSEPHEAKYVGQCHCGTVEFEINVDAPVDASFCHCGTCKRTHGAPFQWAAIFHKENIRCIRGVDKIATYLTHEKRDNRPGEHIIPAKISCGVCRTHIADEGRNMFLLYPMLFRDVHEHKPEGEESRLGPQWSPSKHICYGERIIDITDGVPKFKGMPNKEKPEGDMPEKGTHPLPTPRDVPGHKAQKA